MVGPRTDALAKALRPDKQLKHSEWLQKALRSIQSLKPKQTYKMIPVAHNATTEDEQEPQEVCTQRACADICMVVYGAACWSSAGPPCLRRDLRRGTGKDECTWTVL